MQPDDERARRKELERGTLARQIFDNPLWDEAYTSIVNGLMGRMVAEQTVDEDTLECKRQILALHAVKRHFSTIMETGRLAEIQLQEMRDG